ncbi:hypothetical protein S40285_06036 [Stachybotrys chlorohalonatus IBT 40285]|uniref:FAD-binding PCMH-type domain-containing protein n=1 Tax=Stachybotrys chlorohalonatus (strain IBT 40285) TaxID=1283841 RepID=A0A084Q8R1_STAC4|nr:hypothetical protein S40285_06036 [Stachybotrys chlorohalonata IBT 40285]
MIQSTLLPLALLASQVAAQSLGSPGLHDLKTILLNSELSWSPEALVTFPDDEEDSAFINATERWSIMGAPTYLAAVTPANEEDVVLAVKLAREYNIQFMATGGRHGYVPTHGKLQQGLAIDLTKFDTVEIDSDAATMTIGGGVRASQLTDAVGDAGFEIPLGGCPCPGFVGVTLGGGISNWLGVHGLLIDALLSVRLVTADGDIVEASEEVNPDLFWGIRGAGANFGIIVSATYKLFPPTNNDQMLIVEAAFHASQNVSYYTVLEEIARNQTGLLSLNSVVMFEPGTQQTLIMGNYHYFGDAEEGMAILQPLLDLHPILNNSYIAPWSDFHERTLFGRAAEDCIPGAIRTPFGALAKTADVPTLLRSFNSMATLYRDHPGARQSVWIFHSFGTEATRAVPDDATAYAWRDAYHYTYPLLRWLEGDCAAGAAATAVGYSIRDDIAAHSGYDDLVAYINFAHGDETLEQIFGARKLPRLASLKATWDPDNVFRYHFPLPTSYP